MGKLGQVHAIGQSPRGNTGSRRAPAPSTVPTRLGWVWGRKEGPRGSSSEWEEGVSVHPPHAGLLSHRPWSASLRAGVGAVGLGTQRLASPAPCVRQV